MNRWRGKVALVTGASAGIGAAICRELVQQGMTVVGCARNDVKIKEMSAELNDAPGSLTAIHCDLTQPDQIEAMFSNIKQLFGGVDVVVNNAGANFVGSLTDGDIGKWHTLANLLILATQHCTQLAVQSMQERDVTEGQVININSVVGHQVSVHTELHFYGACKFAVTALTEGLRIELAKVPANSIRVAQISPGPVKTGIATTMFGDPVKGAAFLEGGLEIQTIADAVVYILTQPAAVEIHDIHLGAINNNKVK